MNKNYYKVKCKCGHVGRNHFIAIDFPIIASSGKEAAKLARKMPRCKHHHKDCILEVKRISYEEYISIYVDNSNDPYLNCSSVQEQNSIDLSNRLSEEQSAYIVDAIEEPKHVVFRGKTRIKKPKKFIRCNLLFEYE